MATGSNKRAFRKIQEHTNVEIPEHLMEHATTMLNVNGRISFYVYGFLLSDVSEMKDILSIFEPISVTAGTEELYEVLKGVSGSVPIALQRWYEDSYLVVVMTEAVSTR